MGKRRSESSKSILALGISFLTIGCLLAGTSLAWLCPPQTNASLSGIEGEATGSYFESGNGTSDDPYIIANPKQLYYFSWLQDLGRFNNKKKDSSGSESSNYEQVYFKLAAKLLYFKRDSSGNEQGADVGVIYYTECGCAITPAGNGASTNKDPSSKEENSA